ncbi:hypothetical protein BX667DRAFT_276577 [Coemansia mojavensis]|nr:hypothetical protein BX667DRAFT_276577 [Coemansia mojavensis]
MDMTSTSNSSRMAKRPVPRTEKSRYEVVGYPKSTRAPKREPAARDQSSEKRLRQQPSQSRLKGFEIRTIDTHNGKAVVRAPIVAGSAQGADHNDVPELPPLSAAELRYNAQRALISSTAILRTAVANKQAEQRPAKSSRKAGSVWPSAYSRPPPKSLVRAASERAQSLRMAAESKSPGARSRGFQISMQFDSEQPNPAIQQQPPQTVGLAVPSGIDSSALEQGSASVASVLEQWGLSTPAKSASSSKKQPCRSNVLGNDEDSDSAGEDTRRLVEDIVQGRSPTMVSLLRHAFCLHLAWALHARFLDVRSGSFLMCKMHRLSARLRFLSTSLSALYIAKQGTIRINEGSFAFIWTVQRPGL